MREHLAAHLTDPPTQPIPRVEPPPPTPERTTQGRRLNGLDLLRALASCLVFYTHVAVWYRLKQDPMPVTEVVDDLVIAPLHLNRDLSFAGVALFFLISGFVMAHVATRERTAEFAVKRVLRIFPVLVVASVLAWVLVNLGMLTVPGGDPPVGVGDLLASTVLVTFLVDGFVPLVGVAWTLVVQVGVYAMIGSLLFLFRRAPWLAIAVQIVLCLFVQPIAAAFDGLATASLVNVGAYGTAIVLGQVIWLVWSRRAPWWAGSLLGLACWLLFVLSDSVGYRVHDANSLTLTLGALLVILAVLADQRIPRLRVLTYLSSRSYAVYLVHQTIAFTVLAMLWPAVPSSVAVAVSVAATLAVAELVHRTVERPFAKLATTLTARRPR